MKYQLVVGHLIFCVASLCSAAEWKGTMSCGELQGSNSGRSTAPFKHDLTLTIEGNKASLDRTWATGKEHIEGTVGSGQTLRLEGQGWFFGNEAKAWKTRAALFQSGRGYKGTATIESQDGRIKYRDCTVSLQLPENFVPGILPPAGNIQPASGGEKISGTPSKPKRYFDNEASRPRAPIGGVGTPRYIRANVAYACNDAKQEISIARIFLDDGKFSEIWGLVGEKSKPTSNVVGKWEVFSKEGAVEDLTLKEVLELSASKQSVSTKPMIRVLEQIAPSKTDVRKFYVFKKGIAMDAANPFMICEEDPDNTEFMRDITSKLWLEAEDARRKFKSNESDDRLKNLMARAKRTDFNAYQKMSKRERAERDMIEFMSFFQRMEAAGSNRCDMLSRSIKGMYDQALAEWMKAQNYSGNSQIADGFYEAASRTALNAMATYGGANCDPSTRGNGGIRPAVPSPTAPSPPAAPSSTAPSPGNELFTAILGVWNCSGIEIARFSDGTFLALYEPDKSLSMLSYGTFTVKKQYYSQTITAQKYLKSPDLQVIPPLIWEIAVKASTVARSNYTTSEYEILSIDSGVQRFNYLRLVNWDGRDFQKMAIKTNCKAVKHPVFDFYAEKLRVPSRFVTHSGK